MQDLGQTKQSRWGFRGKTVWNWLELLVVPVVLLGIRYLFSVQQDARQERAENQRTEVERELAEQRAQDDALQAYLDQMTTLVFGEDLRDPREDSDARMLARARTLTILDRVDPDRSSAVLQFLVEADLVNGTEDVGPVISLADANLEGVQMFAPDLKYAALIRLDMNGARLERADLTHANLRNADWLPNEEIEEQVAFLKGAIMPTGQKHDMWLESKEHGGASESK